MARSKPGVAGDGSVGFPGAFADGIVFANDDDEVGVELTQRDDRGRSIAGDRLGEEATILEDRFSGIRGGKSKIQFAWGVVGAVGAAEAAEAGAESVPEPAVEALFVAQGGNLKQLYAVGVYYGRRRGCCEFLFCGGVLAEVAKASGDAGGAIAALADEPCGLKKCVDLPQIFFGFLAGIWAASQS